MFHPGATGHKKQHWEDTTTEGVRGKRTLQHQENITLNHLKVLHVLFVLQLTPGTMGSGKPKCSPENPSFHDKSSRFWINGAEI